MFLDEQGQRECLFVSVFEEYIRILCEQRVNCFGNVSQKGKKKNLNTFSPSLDPCKAAVQKRKVKVVFWLLRHHGTRKGVLTLAAVSGDPGIL